MLTGLPVKEVERVYGHGHRTFPREHIRGVTGLGFYADERGFRDFDGTMPELALVHIGYLKKVRGGNFSTTGKTRRSGHLVLWANGQFYDPAGRIYKMDGLRVGAKIVKVLEVLAP